MYYNIWDSVGFLIGRTQRPLKNLFMQRLKKFGITPEQWLLMAHLSATDSITATALSELSMKDKPYTTRLLDGLEAKGYICRHENPDDKRSVVISLTSQGSDLKQYIIPILIQVDNEVIRHMSEEEVLLLRKLLNKLYDGFKL